MQPNWRSYAGLSEDGMKRSFEEAHGWRRRREFRAPSDLDFLSFMFGSGGVGLTRLGNGSRFGINCYAVGKGDGKRDRKWCRFVANDVRGRPVGRAMACGRRRSFDPTDSPGGGGGDAG